MKETGFIIGMKTKSTYEDIKAMNIPNLLIMPYVPQKALLNSPLIKAFVTHCGANSILESMYFGTPLIGFPLSADQFSGC